MVRGKPIRPTPALVLVGWLGALALTLAACTAGGAPSSTPTGPTPTLGAPSSTSVPTLPPPAHRPQTIHVLEEPLAFQTVTATGCTSPKRCKGDQLIGTSRMIDADTRATVGSFSVECLLLDPDTDLYHCPANAILLTGRGQIVFDETVNIGGQWNPVPWPITSGTGEFLEATGSVTSPKDSTWPYGDFVISITG
jgi:hypothetical protein